MTGPGPAPGRKVRVLVVDDSALMRRLLSDLLGASPEVEVVGLAKDGRDAVLQASRLKPDVITLDVEMPEVSGLEALPLLLATHEAPVVMVSALTQAGADVTLQALELGAVDFMPKPEKNQFAEMRAHGDLLISKVLTAAESRVRRQRRPGSPPPSPSPSASPATPPSSQRPAAARPRLSAAGTAAACVAIGISTGGPQALSQVLPLLSPPMPPILIVQHMPGQFTKVFADRLGRACSLAVKEAAEGDVLQPDRVYVAPGGRHLSVAGPAARPRVAITDDEPVSGHKPSVDVLFRSVARHFQARAVGVIMTGMGRDGVEGCKAILAAGGLTLGQDEATSVVYGMNKAAFLEGAVKSQFALEDLAGILREL
ncbi:Chemotaxis response regulator protein-glutamate methylesterase [Aquisphaera giovannonii]|uniref:Protein-glutamate methylesterase/protein-glutamine glutaminase n=1 Tax=Aquisphaera giovannonii TaxID=406548 RepID=A0A5B9VUW9_9BACT|nr:chemotaxis response regulator protein-glutamate methylesterase [Aquisphaera giovannonii]QEH31677.1 Chemotaxis response regulator protein-glutamate methylesterase [Aquisphaera giovannonii]